MDKISVVITRAQKDILDLLEVYGVDKMSEEDVQVIVAIQENQPFEKVIVVKDQSGRPNHYAVERNIKRIIQRKISYAC